MAGKCTKKIWIWISYFNICVSDVIGNETLGLTFGLTQNGHSYDFFESRAEDMILSLYIILINQWFILCISMHHSVQLIQEIKDHIKSIELSGLVLIPGN